MTLAELRLPPIPDLHSELWTQVRAIPAGTAVSYGAIARALGDVKAAKYVASVLGKHAPEKQVRVKDCPCFRVVRQTGEFGGYAHGGPDVKGERLRSDGVAVDGDRVTGLGTIAVPETTSLGRLRDWQRQIAEVDIPVTLAEVPEFVGGLDVSYAADGRAVAAVVVIETASGNCVWSDTAVVETRFPYITGYLVFRELPAIRATLELANAAGVTPPVMLVDGSGRLHPRRVGVATALAAVSGVPTVGVTKKHLCGSVRIQDARPGCPAAVTVDGRTAGYVIREKPGGNPVYVSPGGGLNETLAARIVSRLTREHRLPEPIYWADRLSRQAAQSITGVERKKT